MEKLIARWESRGGKHWVNLYFNPEFKLANGSVVVDAHYRGNGCGGGIQANTAEDAIIKMEARIAAGGFQPDAAKTPMKRVTDSRVLEVTA